MKTDRPEDASSIMILKKRRGGELGEERDMREEEDFCHVLLVLPPIDLHKSPEALKRKKGGTLGNARERLSKKTGRCRIGSVLRNVKNEAVVSLRIVE